MEGKTNGHVIGSSIDTSQFANCDRYGKGITLAKVPLKKYESGIYNRPGHYCRRTAWIAESNRDAGKQVAFVKGPTFVHKEKS